MLQGRRIILGVTGSIAAYKAAIFVRTLRQQGAEVRVVVTDAACAFVTPLTLATLSGAEVVRDMFPADSAKGTWHIHLAVWADAMIVAPASANTLAKLAHGLADNALTALALALRGPLVVAPAMDADMLLHPATQANLDTLRSRRVLVVPPAEGELASGLTGPGRLPDDDVLCAALEMALRTVPRRALPGEAVAAAPAAVPSLAGVPVLVTAGPTQEPVDPVRYLGNRSSGRMGFALALEAALRGAVVTLVAGPSALPTPPGVRRVDVRTAAEMYDAVHAALPDAGIVVMAAAVADFAPASPAEEKIKKEAGDAAPVLALRRTPDILASLTSVPGRRVTVGFALETADAEANALRKLRAKRCDLLVLNDARTPGAGFGTDTNVAVIFDADGGREESGLVTKRALAARILDRAAALLPGAALA